jgi:hypothetical protein
MARLCLFAALRSLQILMDPLTSKLPAIGLRCAGGAQFWLP